MQSDGDLVKAVLAGHREAFGVLIGRYEKSVRSVGRCVLGIGDGVDDPAHVARMGNFMPVNATVEESWVTVGETLPDDGWKGDTLLARIRWTRPNYELSWRTI